MAHQSTAARARPGGGPITRVQDYETKQSSCVVSEKKTCESKCGRRLVVSHLGSKALPPGNYGVTAGS